MTWSLQRHRAEQQQAELGLQCSQKVKDRDLEEPLSKCSKREVETARAFSPAGEEAAFRGEQVGHQRAMWPNSPTGSGSLRVSSDKLAFEGHAGVQDLTDAE